MFDGLRLRCDEGILRIAAGAPEGVAATGRAPGAATNAPFRAFSTGCGRLAPSMAASSSGMARRGRFWKRCRLRLGSMGRRAMPAGGPKVKSAGLWAACLRVMARQVKSSESWAWLSRSPICGGQSA